MPAPTLATLAKIPGLTTRVVVGVGELGTSNNPAAVLTTFALGSCLGITIYDPVTRTGGLLHSMLPDSTINPAKARQQPAMFIDTGVPALFRAAYDLKADKHRIQICVAGGAQVLDSGAIFNIGQRNYTALSRILNQHGLVVRAEHVGGLASRTMTLNLATGEVRLKVGGVPGEQTLFRG